MEVINVDQCTLHNETINKISNIDKRLSTTEESVKQGWDVIKKNARKCEALPEIDSRSKSNTHRLDNIENLIGEIHQMNANLTNLTKSLVNMSSKVEKHDEKINHIENKVDDVSNIKKDIKQLDNSMSDHITKFKEKIHEIESLEGKEAKKMLNRLQWLLISLVGTASFYIIWEVVIK